MGQEEQSVVNAQLRSLERKLVMERAEVAVKQQVHNLMLAWEVALCFGKPLPDPFDFIWGIRDDGFNLRTYSATIEHLSECKRESRQPDEKRLLQMLLPWIY